ncbi:MAG: hypothetical protein EHM70_05080 [Chloroflexota bacterium]|nr:MAG: hypothetical protein EHM70_05080 [Chloroflexota bacterium]
MYEIRIKNHLNSGWFNRFEGLILTNLENGEAIISGPIVDQSALHGLLARIRDLNLTLISVKEIDPEGR